MNTHMCPYCLQEICVCLVAYDERIQVDLIPLPKTTRPLRVFLCHASEDKPEARELYSDLCQDKFAPWLDEEEILPGQDWKFEILKAIEDSDIVIVCLSCSSVNKSGFVQKEIRYALEMAEEQLEGTIYIIPVRLEDCEVPRSLLRFQWVDIHMGAGYKKLLRALRRRAEELGLFP